jgi:hypothetical protein
MLVFLPDGSADQGLEWPTSHKRSLFKNMSASVLDIPSAEVMTAELLSQAPFQAVRPASTHARKRAGCRGRTDRRVSSRRRSPSGSALAGARAAGLGLVAASSGSPLHDPEGAQAGASFSRQPRPQRKLANSYEWPCRGERFRIDPSKHAFLAAQPRPAPTNTAAPRGCRDRPRYHRRTRPLKARLLRAPRRTPPRPFPRERACLLRSGHHHPHAVSPTAPGTPPSAD